MNRTTLDSTEYNAYYGNYISLVSADTSLIENLKIGEKKTLRFFKSIPEDKLKYAYEEGKWTILDVLLHIIDTERIFAYRALRIARGDKKELVGFDQDEYIGPAKANTRSLESLLNEYMSVRRSTVCLFEVLDNESLKRMGTAGMSPLSARAAGFVIAGHEIHHANIIEERYL